MSIRKFFWFVILLITFSIFMIWFTNTYSSYPNARDMFIRLAIIGLLFLIINWVWTFISIKKLSIDRQQRLLRFQVGNVFEEEYEIVNPIRFSRIWIEIEDLSNLPGKPGSKVISDLGPKKNRFYNSRTILTKRGSYELGPTLLRSGDPFGMFVSEKIIPSSDELIVLPYFEQIHHFTEPPGYIQGGRAIRQKSLEATSFASGVREYQSGDPLNRIHWKTSAKKAKFMVKEFDQDPQSDIWVLVDGDENINCKIEETPDLEFADTFWALKRKTTFKLPKDTFEYAISIAASIVSYFIQAEKSVGLACADSVMTVIPTEKGRRQLGKILETMAFFEGNGKVQINEVVESMGNQMVRGSTVVIVSAADEEEIQICMDILLRRKLKPVIIHIVRESFQYDLHQDQKNLKSISHSININYGDSISATLEKIIV